MCDFNSKIMIFWGAEPREGTEAFRVQEEVKKKKKIAEDKKVKELISELYFGLIQYFPSWLKNNNREDVPKIISEATEEKEDKSDIVKIILNKKKYKFIFSQSSFDTLDGEYLTHGLLKLLFKDQVVLAINLSLEHSDYDSSWDPFEIKAFIDGDWIDDFTELKKAEKDDRRSREIIKAEDPKKIEELKKNFGIE